MPAPHWLLGSRRPHEVGCCLLDPEGADYCSCHLLRRSRRMARLRWHFEVWGWLLPELFICLVCFVAFGLLYAYIWKG